MPMSSDPGNADAKASANAYLLLMLMQRLEGAHPGLIADLLAGVDADFTAIERDGRLTDALRAIREQTRTLLKQAASGV